MQLDFLLERIAQTVESHRLSEGAYARWLYKNGTHECDCAPNEYGCADAANLLYTIGAFVREPQARAKWVAILQGMQAADTGLFCEPTHHPLHTTAHCVAALALFDQRPAHPLAALAPYRTREGLFALLEGLDWLGNPWPQSHQGAGVFAALTIAGEADAAWQNAYFAWLREHCDPKWGMSLRGAVDAQKAPAAHHLYGWFHYIFNHESAHRPIPYAAKLVDTCIELYKDHALGERFGRMVGFMEIDWVFCLNRALRQAPQRFAEGKAQLQAFARAYVDWLAALDWRTDAEWNDLHMLFGASCALAELAQALPGEIETTVPLRLVLDRRPFI